ncbi:CypX Cytochrome P450 [Pyrenophora tritici-repentis]|uniref:CypX, Cytochrome P450 n=1 Tax=Pyrenophora tritici-repentis TaxID=45151 RepID=A0A5M9LR70_9PLEO|nr:Cytochrome P450 monooxygenase [Pyrenophora tritici-repentis]KAF7454888.1 Cytochrome P450 monooxygenase [Pyrenophora tritici-repentis]KAF7578034.1 CypX, Cytochrome P450 [Pyrenophora tritici-repentis]KAI0579200.1 Cytochrome P450 monooxygenase [Pyrenophora tritici-repentis]KAI1535070.1 CypX Cytochrome P450 [Pyrenophora tritici-repentis]
MDSVRAFNTPTVVLITSTLILTTFLLYRWLLPKPIPGIPFNPEATKSIFGDIPSLINHLKTHKTISDWILSHNTRHDSPIVQAFANLFGKPWVIISDYREAQDILMRRTKEFDKPDALSDIFFSIVPDHHAVQATNDAYRSQRKLLQDLMTPSFLHGVTASKLHNNFMDLIKLWTEKMRLSKGRSFSVKNDVYDTALGAIWATVFGIAETTTITRNQINLLSPMKGTPLPSAVDEAVDFPRAPTPMVFDAILRLTDSLEYVLKSPFPRLTGRFMRYMPSIRTWIKLKDDVINAQISTAEKRMAHTKDNGDRFSNGVDHMLRRELMAAERQKRMPDYHSNVMVAELFGLLIAGHDTTSTTLLWAMKLLAADQVVQSKLRSALQSGFAAAYSEDRVPNAQEIVTTQSHYLDACIEEILRCAQTAIIPSRNAVTDAVVLGHVIPKGTRVMMCGNGGGILTPSFEIDSALRSKSYHNADGGKVGIWDSEGIKKFKPDRWLQYDQATDCTIFNAAAGPHLLFGAGPRSCFGRRLAHLELRLAIVLILWSFELQPVPERYGSWEAMEQLTHSPIQCYVKLIEAQNKLEC